MISPELRAEAERRALEDFNAAVGKEITVQMISGYNDSDDGVDVDGVSIRVRVDSTKNVSLDHWVDEYLDPYWDVTPIGEYPELTGLRSFWTFGPSYRVIDGKVEAVENNQSTPHSAL